jgi:MFS family permease
MGLDPVLEIAAAVTALAAAARSTWSPCGLSMLSSITPFGERSRGNRYGATAAWFIAGAASGGATLGGVAYLLASAASALGLPHHLVPVGLVAAAVCVLGAAFDAEAFGSVLPVIRRQVDDRWLSRYRSWVYAAGFGWQIGCGVATYVMTAAVFVFVFLAACSAEPTSAFFAAVAFGVLRGGAVLLTSRATDPASLRALHLRLDRAEQPVRWTAIAVQACVGAALCSAVYPPAGAGLLALALIVGALSSSRKLVARANPRPGVAPSAE